MQMVISHVDNTPLKSPFTSPRNNHSDRVSASTNWCGSPGDLMRDLLALPARLGGISMPNPSKTSNKDYAFSLRALKRSHPSKNPSYPIDAITKNARLKKETHRLNRSTILSEATDLKGKLNDTLQRAMELASEKGASSWLTALPLAKFVFSLHKGAFRDAVALRYGWLPPQSPPSM